jgi:hypothetical protein
MSKKEQAAQRAEARRRIREIRREIVALGLVAAGTLRHRTKVCGKPGCSCAVDPAARHGPYYEWSRLEGKKLRQTAVPAAEAPALEAAMANHTKIKALLKQWEYWTLVYIRAGGGEQKV